MQPLGRRFPAATHLWLLVLKALWIHWLSRSFAWCLWNPSTVKLVKWKTHIHIYMLQDRRDPPSPPMVMVPPLWCGGCQSLMLCKGYMNKYKAYLSVCRSKKGSMKRFKAKRVQGKEEAYLIAIVLQSISSPLWWWCAADIASKEGEKEERKKGKREGKEKGSRERRKEEEGKKKEGEKEEGRTKGSPLPLGLGGAGGYHWGGLSVPGPGTYIESWKSTHRYKHIYIYICFCIYINIYL